MCTSVFCTINSPSVVVGPSGSGKSTLLRCINQLEAITDLLNDGSDPDALYIIEHHIAHYDFDTLEKIA
ncbi:ribonuclease E inhibitor RraB, partial [Bacillus sp. SS-TM]